VVELVRKPVVELVEIPALISWLLDEETMRRCFPVGDPSTASTAMRPAWRVFDSARLVY